MKLCYGTTVNDRFFVLSSPQRLIPNLKKSNIFCFVSPSRLLMAFSHTALGNYICLLCYVLGIKLWKLLWIVEHLFQSFSFSVRPLWVYALCVCVCVCVCEGERGAILNANTAESRVRKGAEKLVDDKLLWAQRAANIKFAASWRYVAPFVVRLSVKLWMTEVSIIQYASVLIEKLFRNTCVTGKLHTVRRV